MNMLPSFANFTYIGPDNIRGQPVERWLGSWTVNPSPYYNMQANYYVAQVFGWPVEVFFNPYPYGQNNNFYTQSFTTNYDAWATYVSPTVGCNNAKVVKYEELRALVPTINVDACNYVN